MEIPDRMVHRGEARERYGELVDRMGYWLRQTDPLADNLIAATRDWSRHRLIGAVTTALRQGPDAVDGAPDELYALVDQVTTVPAWVDRARTDHGAAFFLSTHIVGGIVLGAKSLVSGYAAPAGNKPLVLSGRLQHGTHGRLAETSKFVYDVSRPGGLEPGADGVVAAVVVRLIHAQVRDMIHREVDWNPEWGAPINQHDMLATVLLFSYAWQEGLITLGLSPTDRELEDHTALWRYIGYLMGVDQELLPADRDEAERYADFIELTQGRPDDDARELTRAFLETEPPEEADTDAGPSPAVAYALTRTLLGDSMADDLAIPDSPLATVVPLATPLVTAVDRLRRTRPGFRRAVDAGHDYWQWVLDTNPEGLAEFTLHEELFGLDRQAA